METGPVRAPPSVEKSLDAANTSVGRLRGGAEIGMKAAPARRPAAARKGWPHSDRRRKPIVCPTKVAWVTLEGVGRRLGHISTEEDALEFIPPHFLRAIDGAIDDEDRRRDF